MSVVKTLLNKFWHTNFIKRQLLMLIHKINKYLNSDTPVIIFCFNSVRFCFVFCCCFSGTRLESESVSSIVGNDDDLAHGYMHCTHDSLTYVCHARVWVRIFDCNVTHHSSCHAHTLTERPKSTKLQVTQCLIYKSKRKENKSKLNSKNFTDSFSKLDNVYVCS